MVETKSHGRRLGLLSDTSTHFDFDRVSMPRRTRPQPLRCFNEFQTSNPGQCLFGSRHLPSLTSLLLRGLSSLASSLPFHSSSRNMNITVSNEMTGSGISYSPSASASVPRSFCGICRASRFLRRISSVAGGNAFIMK